MDVAPSDAFTRVGSCEECGKFGPVDFRWGRDLCLWCVAKKCRRYSTRGSRIDHRYKFRLPRVGKIARGLNIEPESHTFQNVVRCLEDG